MDIIEDRKLIEKWENSFEAFDFLYEIFEQENSEK